MRTDRAIGLLLPLLVICIVSMASGQVRPNHSTQQSGAVKTKPTSVGIIISGRVFAITKAGDLKPARMARVFVLYSYSGPRSGEKETAYIIYLSKTLDQYKYYLTPASIESRAKLKGIETKQAFCVAGLEAEESAARMAVKWSLDNGKQWQVNQTITDEEGNFSVSTVRPGSYVLMAFGHAGWYEGKWESKLTVAAGNIPTIKLAYPEKSCSDIAGE